MTDLSDSTSATAKYGRIMVVDDDLDVSMWEIVAQTFPDTLLLISTGGLVALRHLDQFDYKVDAIITDLSMPDIDGLSLTKLVRRNEDIRSLPQIPIFWLTGYPIGETLDRARLQYKVAGVFKKPFSPLDMIAEVKGYINDETY